ncbi:hypothetical protein V8C86DRAFT_701749 [Haematococcus lacustris]
MANLLQLFTVLCAMASAGVRASSLPAFTSVKSCVPFTVLVAAPSAGNSGALSVDADAQVAQQVKASVNSGVLTLTLAGGFTTTRTIRCTITAPNANSLKSVETQGIGSLVVGPGFNLPSLAVKTSGTAGVYVLGSTIGALDVDSSGNGQVFVDSLVKQGARISSDGISAVTLAGSVEGAVRVDTDGISSTFINSGPGTTITGKASGLAKILYRGGQCDLRSDSFDVFAMPAFPGGQCSQVRSVPAVPRAAWTCGIKVQGQSTCGGGSSAQASASQRCQDSAPQYVV